ncbi:MAG: response regulator [Candidatus Shapirobacteria bacterium]|jgi:CheY-like chemotaxis protein
MVEKANVFVVDDDPSQQKTIRRLLESAGHHVAASAQSLSEALAIVPQLRDLGVQVATLDGSLYGVRTAGQLVLAAIKKQAPEVKTIGLSGNRFPTDTNIRVDIDLTKDFTDEIAETITRL